jgi:hypothetical protein
MSWDLSVATRERPSGELIAAWARDEGVTVEHNGISRGGETLFLVDGPDEVERDDLDEGLADAVPDAAWALLISVPLALESKATRALATRLGAHVAQRCGGAVYDKQRDELVWPQRRAAPRPTREEVDALALAWYAPRERVRDGAAAFVSATRQGFPPALPRRYGTCQPYQGRLDPAAPGAFVDAWRTSRRGELAWSASPPCYDGSCSFDPRDPRDGARQVGEVHLLLDARALAERAVREGVIALWLEVAASLRAFYAIAAVRRRMSLSRGRLWVSGSTEELDLPLDRWYGLTAQRTWLAWYAPPYDALMAPVLGDHAVRRDGGLFVRATEAPANADDLAGLVPPTPATLIGDFREQRVAPVLPPL